MRKNRETYFFYTGSTGALIINIYSTQRWYGVPWSGVLVPRLCLERSGKDDSQISKVYYLRCKKIIDRFTQGKE